MNFQGLNMTYDNLKCFLLFLNRGRSGSSLCGGLISCHPNAIIAHEKEFKNFDFTDEIDLYNLLIEAQTNKKFVWQPLRGITTWRDMKQYENIRVIGTKKQGTLIKSISDFEKLETLKNKISIPVKFINIYRNPFDNITTIYNKSQRPKHIKTGTTMKDINRAITYYFNGIRMTQEVINREDVLNVQHENLVDNTRKVLVDICEFLDLPLDDEYLDFCKTLIWKQARQTRNSIDWSVDNIMRVEKLKNKYDFLKGYSYEI